MTCLRTTTLAVAAGLVFSLAATAASAQVFSWEEVGGIPIDARDLDFAPDGALWATTSSRLYRLPPGGAVWEEVYDGPGSLGDNLLALSPDTLFRAHGSGISRSLDAGQTWTGVFDDGGALDDMPLTGPSRGLLLSGTADSIGVAYSQDRGTTWRPASIIDNTAAAHNAQAFAEAPFGHPHEGRLTTAALAGLRYSDDGGATWIKSNVHEDFRFIADDVEVAADGRVWATAADGTLPGAQVYVSDDGATWAHVGTFYLPDEATWPARLVVVPGGPQPEVGVLLVVTVKGRVYRSTDGGKTWPEQARVPLDVPTSFVHDALMGPDGRLYVSVVRSGTEEEWVYRTAGTVVASEPGPAETPGGFTLEPPYPNPSRGGAVVPFALSSPAHVRVAVYDALGREVAVLAEGAFAAGEHEARLDGADLPSGTYLVRATVEGATARSRTVTLLR